MINGAAYGFRQPQTLGIVGKGEVFTAADRRGQPSSLFPGHGPASAVVVAGGIARCVIGDGLPVVSREQILPNPMSLDLHHELIELHF